MDNSQETNTLFMDNSQGTNILFIMDNLQGTTPEIINDHIAEQMLDTPLDELIENNDRTAFQTPILQGEGCHQPSPEQYIVPGCTSTPLMPANYAHHNMEPNVIEESSSTSDYALGNTTNAMGCQSSVPQISETQYSVSPTSQADHSDSPPQFETLVTPGPYIPCTNEDIQESHGPTSTDQTLNIASIEPDNVRSVSQAFNTIGVYVNNDLNGFYAHEITNNLSNTFGQPQVEKSGSKSFNYIGNHFEEEVQGEPTVTDRYIEEFIAYCLSNEQLPMNSGPSYITNNDNLAVQDSALSVHQPHEAHLLPDANTSCVDSNLYNEPQNRITCELSNQPNTLSLPAEPTNLNSPLDMVDRQVTTDEGNQIVDSVEPDKGDNEETLMNVNAFPPPLTHSAGIGAITASEYTPPPAQSRRSRKKLSAKRIKVYERQEPFPEIEKERRRKDAIRAKNCRDKNKSRMDELEITVKGLQKENTDLGRINANLLQEVEARRRYECHLMAYLKANHNIILQQYQQDWSATTQ